MRIKREVRTINGVEKLKCSKCNYWLTFDEFSNDKATSTGKRAYCKCCQKKYNGKRRKRPYNSGIIGLYLETCSQCKTQFTTKSSARSFCSQKCARRWHYEKNEQTETGKLYGRSKVIFNIKRMNKESIA
jgi:hypothetical protein